MNVKAVCGVAGMCLLASSSALRSMPAWGEPAQGIRCSIDVPTPIWVKGSPATAIVSIENLSSSSKQLDITSDFTLSVPAVDEGHGPRERSEYWAPVELSPTSKPLPANTTFRVSIPPFEVLRYEVDLAKLKWAKNISALWPSRELFSTAPAGTYTLTHDIHFGTNTNPNGVHSNAVDVTVK